MQNCDIPEIRKVHRLNPIGKNDKYGIRLYRDEEILLLGMNDLADRWGLLLHDGRLSIFHNSFAQEMPHSSEGFNGYLLTVSPIVWQAMDTYGLSSRLESSPFYPGLELSEDKAYALSLMMDLLEHAIGSRTDKDNGTELIYLCRAMMATICGFCNFKEVTENVVAQDRITNRFLQLVDKNCLKERSLKFYAEKLDITPKYLSAVISNATGKRAGQWIAENAVDRMKVLLTTTSFTLEELTRLTGFIDSSTFCRYFRKYTGISPMRYKKKTLREIALSGSPSSPQDGSPMTGWPYAENNIENKIHEYSFIRGI